MFYVKGYNAWSRLPFEGLFVMPDTFRDFTVTSALERLVMFANTKPLQEI